jgi:hypothetical protein
MIVKRALEEPFRQIVANAGLEGSVIVEKVKAEKGVGRGFDAETLRTRWSRIGRDASGAMERAAGHAGHLAAQSRMAHLG